MSGGRKPNTNQEPTGISILLVDDIPEARDNIEKLLAFEKDFKVVGKAGTGREGVQMTKELQPDVVIMDINMPDMDGLEATTIINKQVPTSAVIIMSVQDDPDYMRRALRAGARDFLSKPVNMDDLYSTIRTVYTNHEAVRRRYAAIDQFSIGKIPGIGDDPPEGDRAGHVIAVYSPQGGAGVTTIATSLASGLMKEDVRVLLVDADLQFADIGTFLNLQGQSSIVEAAKDVDDLDVDLFDNIVMTHDSGLKVLLGPPRPEAADTVVEKGTDTVAKILAQIRSLYDFVIVDTATRLDEVQLSIFEQATRVLMVGTPTLISVKNMRLVLDVFDKLDYDKAKTVLAINKMMDDRRGKAPTLPVDRIESYLRAKVVGKIPYTDERIMLGAINKGVPVIALDRNQDRPPMKQLYELANALFADLNPEEEDEELLTGSQNSKRRTRFGR